VQHAVLVGGEAKTNPTTTMQQRWEENRVPLGVPICLDTKKNTPPQAVSQVEQVRACQCTEYTEITREQVFY
jgi:hypothetical protein